MMKKSTAFIVFVFLFQTIFGQKDQVIIPGNVKSIDKNSDRIIIKTDQARMMIQVYSPLILRFRYSNTDFEKDFSYAVIRKPGSSFKTFSETDTSFRFTTDSLVGIINKKHLSVKLLNLKNEVLCEDYQPFSHTTQGTRVTCYKKLFPDEKFLGLGEKTGNVNHRGEKFENWNSDIPAYSLKEDPLYQTIPFYLGVHDKVTYGIFLDNTFRTYFNFGASTDEQFSSFSAASGELNYYFFGAPDLPGILRDYTWLTGRMPLPPLWSLGYQQCRWSYFPESEVLDLANTFRMKKIPCDVIYLDIDYMESYKIFTWDNRKFPAPKAMIGKLNDLGFHVVTIIDPGIKIEKGYFAYDEGLSHDYFARYPGGSNYIGNVWPGRCHFPDFTREEVRNWWGNSFSRLTEPGVEGFWNDMNEPSAWGQDIPDIVEFGRGESKASMAAVHNIYGLNMAKATYEGTKSLMNGKRPFTLTRAGYAGIQRYAAVWTGDNEASDEHMLLSARMVNTLGLSGISFAGPDIGGFIGNPSKELYQRWLSLGVYTPFFRNHSAWGTNHKEPWSFGEDVENFSREMIGQRYRLLPYLYSMFYQSTLTGIPVARSLALNHPFDEKVYWYLYQNEYMFGDNLLVAPVSCTQNAAKIYLPSGDWYRLQSGERFHGNSEVLVDAALNNLPVFVKASGILPLQSLVQSTSQKPSSMIELHIYQGDSPNSFLYYEDDGVTYGFEKGEYYKRTISFDPEKKTIRLSSVTGTFTSRFSSIKLALHKFGELMILHANGIDYSLKLKSAMERTAEIPMTNSEMILQY